MDEVSILIAFVIAILITIMAGIISFIFEVPKQLKRIADALEKENGNGRFRVRERI